MVTNVLACARKKRKNDQCEEVSNVKPPEKEKIKLQTLLKKFYVRRNLFKLTIYVLKNVFKMTIKHNGVQNKHSWLVRQKGRYLSLCCIFVDVNRQRLVQSVHNLS